MFPVAMAVSQKQRMSLTGSVTVPRSSSVFRRGSYWGETSSSEDDALTLEDDNTTTFGSEPSFVEAGLCRSHLIWTLILLLAPVPFVGWTWWKGGAPWEASSTSNGWNIVVDKGPQSWATEERAVDRDASPELVIGNVNILVLTDTHGWMGGHNPEHEPYLNIDYGHVLSFYQRLKDLVAPAPLFLVHNGDFCDGTGLSSTPPPRWEVSLLQQMPWDAMNVGNHELYRKKTIQYLEREMIPHVDYYLASNVVGLSTKSSKGETARPWTGRQFRIVKQNGVRVLFFGFLYNMKNFDAAAQISVQEVQEVMQQEWLKTVLLRKRYDAIVVLAHMDLQDALVEVIRRRIRSVVSATLPVLFLTGHTHYRGYLQDSEKDAYTASFEAGRYLDTVGFVSLETRGRASPNFHHVFLDAHVDSLQQALNSVAAPHTVPLDTPDGRALSRRIQHVVDDILHLNTVVACGVPETYFAAHAIHRPTSLWRLYLEQVVPFSFPIKKNQVALIHSKGMFRYDLFEGTATVDDVIAVAPFHNKLVWVASNVSGATLKEAFENTQHGILPPPPYLGELPKFLVFPMHLDTRHDDVVFAKVLTTTFDAPDVARKLNVSVSSIRPVEPGEAGYNVTAHDLWIRYLNNTFPCRNESMEFMTTTTTTSLFFASASSSSSAMRVDTPPLEEKTAVSNNLTNGEKSINHRGLIFFVLFLSILLVVVTIVLPVWWKRDTPFVSSTAIKTFSTGYGSCEMGVGQ